MGMFQKTDPPTGEPSRAFTLDQMEQLREIIGLVKSSNPEASDKLLEIADPPPDLAHRISSLRDV